MKQRTLEVPVKDQIRAVLDARGVWYRMPPANGYGKSGNFDFVCCVNGLFLGIEAKRDAKEMPTQLQTDNAIAARKANGVVLLIHKDNIATLAMTVDAMHQRDIEVPSYWPLPRPQPIDDIKAPIVRRKERA